jgi:hypothetical protein
MTTDFAGKRGPIKRKEDRPMYQERWATVGPKDVYVAMVVDPQPGWPPVLADAAFLSDFKFLIARNYLPYSVARFGQCFAIIVLRLVQSGLH